MAFETHWEFSFIQAQPPRCLSATAGTGHHSTHCARAVVEGSLWLPSCLTTDSCLLCWALLFPLLFSFCAQSSPCLVARSIYHLYPYDTQHLWPVQTPPTQPDSEPCSCCIFHPRSGPHSLARMTATAPSPSLGPRPYGLPFQSPSTREPQSQVDPSLLSTPSSFFPSHQPRLQPLTLMYFPELSVPSLFACLLVYGQSLPAKCELQWGRGCSVDSTEDTGAGTSMSAEGQAGDVQEDSPSPPSLQFPHLC